MVSYIDYSSKTKYNKKIKVLERLKIKGKRLKELSGFNPF